MESGLDIVSPEGERGNCWITAFTWVENADSLAAVKKLVFDEKKYTMDQLVTALEANWEGYEEMRLDFVKNAPKWGNDDDYVDDIMLRCLRECARFSKVLKCPERQQLADPSGERERQHPLREHRRTPFRTAAGSGMPCTTAGSRPDRGWTRRGPRRCSSPAARSTTLTDGRAFLLNQRLSPTQLRRGDGLSALEGLHEDLGRSRARSRAVQRGLGSDPALPRRGTRRSTPR